MWCSMTRSTEWLSKWIYILAAGLYFVAVTLRAWLFFRDGPYLGRALGLLMLWLFLIGSGFLVKRFPNLIAGYNTMSIERKKNVDIDP